jgi:AraC family transcriptional regulator
MSNRLQQALDYIEAHLGEPLSLPQVACQAHLSSYYFSRLFRAHFGMSPMEYVRLRRLAEATSSMRDNREISIMELALQYGFETPQGFTTAFKRAYQIAPSTYRARPFALPTQERIYMTEQSTRAPGGPVYRDLESFAVVGLAQDFTQDSKALIPELWDRFIPIKSTVTNQCGTTTYGVCISKGEGNFGYLAGLEVAAAQGSSTDLAEGFTYFEVPAGHYAVFTHHGKLDHLQETIGYIFGQWPELSGHKFTGAPDFERYDERFKDDSDTSILEYWVPIERPATANLES